MAARAVMLPDVDPTQSTPRRPGRMQRDATVGTGLMKKKTEEKKSRAAAKKAQNQQLDPLVAREDILAALHAMLAKAEAVPNPGETLFGDDADDGAVLIESADDPPPSLSLPHPPAGPKPSVLRNPHNLHLTVPSRPDSGSGRIARSAASSPRTPRAMPVSAAPSPRGGSAQQHPGSARRAPNSRDFLMTVLAPNRADSNQDGLPEASIPTWKEELVERVRRRTSTANASKRTGGASPRSAAGMLTRPATATHAPADDELGDSYAGGGDASAVFFGRSSQATLLSQSGVSEGGATSAEAALKAARHEKELRKRHSILGFFRDAISDLILTAQFQEADLAQRSAQLQKLLQQSAVAGGAGGRLAAGKQTGSEFHLGELSKKMIAQLELQDGRASEAANVNLALEKMINELRRERASQLELVRARTEREQSMTVDMRTFAATAHAALDEKERIKGRIRRMRHEWKGEKTTQESEKLTLARTEADLERQIEMAQAEEEMANQDTTRRECREMREESKTAEYRELRVGYLRAQSAALSNEFRKLGEVAGVTRGTGGSDRGGERFNHEDPSTSGVLTRTLRANDVRNESAHSYVQSLDQEVELLAEEVAALGKEETALKERERLVQLRKVESAAAAEREYAEALEFDVKHSELEGRMVAMRPQLTAFLSRLNVMYHASPTDAPPLPDVEAPLPARRLTSGLNPLPIDQMPVYHGTQIELEHLDVLMQSMASRVTRIVGARIAAQPPEVEGPPVLDPALRMFTELPPELTFAQLKASREEMEIVVSRHKEQEETET